MAKAMTLEDLGVKDGAAVDTAEQTAAAATVDAEVAAEQAAAVAGTEAAEQTIAAETESAANEAQAASTANNDQTPDPDTKPAENEPKPVLFGVLNKYSGTRYRGAFCFTDIEQFLTEDELTDEIRGDECLRIREIERNGE